MRRVYPLSQILRRFSRQLSDMRFPRFAVNILWLFLLLAGFSSCNTTKYLEVDEFLLKSNDIKFRNAKDVDNKRKIKYELTKFYKQVPNSNFFFIPREWFYYKTNRPKDTTKLDRWVRRVIAEPPALYDEELAQATSTSMERYMNYRGYFNAEVVYAESVNKKRNKIKITYYIDAGKRLRIDTTFFISEDPKIARILERIKPETYLEAGEPVDGLLYEQEKERITRQLQNSGYASFLSNYVGQLEADTTLKPNKANLYLEVLPPPNDSLHQVYFIGDISVYPDFDPLLEEGELQDTTIAGLLFKTVSNQFEVKPQTIINGIYLKKGNLYRQEDYDKSIRALSALGIFRFVRIKQEVDSTNVGILNFRVELTPNPKLEVGVDFELNYTNRSTSAASGDLIGLSISPSIKNRNLLKGAELLVSNLSAGVEVNPSSVKNPRFWNTVDLRLQSELFIPKFLDYFNIWRGFNNLFTSDQKIATGQDFYTRFKENATTRISASYNYLLLLDFYRYNLFNAYYGFDLQRSNTHRYIINQVGIDFLKPFTEPAFKEILDTNPFLERSFGQQLFVSLLFRDFNLLYTSRPNRYGASKFLGAHLEMAGAEVWAGNKIFNALASEPDTLRLGNTDFSQYIKSELDFRYYQTLSPKNSMATRASIGIALPFGFTSDVPYVKQFYVGGPSSIRAWPARSLGPGGYEDTTFNINSIENRLLFFQTGDIKLEFNLEYRFDIFWRFKGALFLDGGNIWTLREDPNRCGSRFRFGNPDITCDEATRSRAAPFYKQIALGSGFGLRLDFTYFIFRLDLGVRLRNPFPLRGTNGNIREGDYWTDFSKWQLRDVNFNIGLGYPF
jgi:outer membrane protein insertion porin family